MGKFLIKMWYEDTTIATQIIEAKDRAKALNEFIIDIYDSGNYDQLKQAAKIEIKELD